jgi:predicted component of type VI protein secretion system
VDDPARSVSKTHAVLEVGGEGISVTDLHSTNGVRVMSPAGASPEVAPGVAIPLESGSTVLLGSFRLRVEAT